METKPELQAAERIVENCINGKVFANADILMARKITTEEFLKVMISVISDRHVAFNDNPEEKRKLAAAGDLNLEKVDCAFRDIPLPDDVHERRALKTHIKNLKYKAI